MMWPVKGQSRPRHSDEMKTTQEHNREHMVYIYSARTPQESGSFLVTNRGLDPKRYTQNGTSVLLPIGEGFATVAEAQAYIDALPGRSNGKSVNDSNWYPFQAT